MSAVDTAVGVVPAGTTPPGEDASEAPWERLHPRLIWVNLARFALSLVPTLLSFFVFKTGSDLLDNWPALIMTGFGIAVSVGDVVRWLRTRYRVTEGLVEIRTGRLVRVYRQIPRDRIRAVDVKSRLRHRFAGLRIVYISSGRSKPAVKLDAVSKQMALTLQRELMHGNRAAAEGEEGEEVAAPKETPIAEFRWRWLFYHVLNFTCVLVGGLLLWSLHSMLLIVGLDLVGSLNDLRNWFAPDGGTAVAWLYWGVVVTLLGYGALAGGFVMENWGFRLVRVRKEDGTALLTRRGLFSTREVHRDDRRMRGIQISEPLLTRWIGLTETTVLSTGLAIISFSGDPATSILPRAPLSEARRVAALVLPGPVRPLEAPLRRHPRTALARRLLWALVTPVVVAGLLVWLWATDVVPGWVPAVVGPVLFAVAVPLAVVAYRALGHTLVDNYLVLRCGLSRRVTAALRTEAVIGVKVRQSLFQRRLGLLTAGLSTAAGERYYQAPDMSVDQFLVFATEAAPGLLEEFLVEPEIDAQQLPAPSPHA
ncbi:PH domain-containing protein [Streptomyces lunaelactis]|uniref:PH domain-containing protein n=1 Tax=Streptomyces lunaelactis TaxID=1535768 RepID=UPI001585879D|nr:PH domain-containing protein [Streptomyces lunaelactis]NUK11904.1 PH domain-containing protein [Streptomyces lunaelactis]NUK37881.1 PH domain-containing protein [Streptomyces lunaelactis]NUK94933.1 PH domain-containing protein [Streptomyces lunaelactis]